MAGPCVSSPTNCREKNSVNLGGPSRAALTRHQRDIASLLAELGELQGRCVGLLKEKKQALRVPFGE